MHEHDFLVTCCDKMVTEFATSSEPLDKLHQPRSSVYPTRRFGKKNPVKWAFRAACFERWGWLHYDETSDVAFYFLICPKAEMGGKLLTGSVIQK